MQLQNVAAKAQRSIVYRWWPETPECDRTGNQVWADFDDNVLVILIRSWPRGQFGQIDPLSAGTAESRFRLSTGEEIVIKRCTNQLIVVDSAGLTFFFELHAGEAESFFRRVGLQIQDDFFAILPSLLGDDDRKRIRELIRADPNLDFPKRKREEKEGNQ